MNRMKRHVTASTSKEKKVKYERIYAYRYGCNKCTRIFYNADYYDAHLVTDHRIRNTLKHNPVVIKKINYIVTRRETGTPRL